MNFKVVLPRKITKEYILENATQESLMSYYLGVPVSKKLFRNPMRNDRFVTCGYFIGKSGDIVFHDFATGKALDFIGVVREKYNLSYSEALRLVATDLGLIKPRGIIPKKVELPVIPEFKDTGRAKIQIETKPFTEQELEWWNKYGISKETLDKFNVFSAKTVFLNENIFSQSSPKSYSFGYYFGKKDGEEIWKIYYPLNSRRTLRFLTNCPKNLLQGAKQLSKSGDILVITKSMKDTMCLYELGVNSVSCQSETSFISSQAYNNLSSRFNKLLVVFDNDLPGISAMNKFRKQNPEFNIRYLWIPRKYETKDISDFYLKYGKDQTIKLIKQTRQLLVK